MLNKKFIINLMGLVLMFESLFMFVCAGVALIYREGDFTTLLIATFITFVTGALSWYPTRKVPKDLIKREGFIVVSLVWVVMSVFGALPYYISGYIPSYTDAFFETISGFTTTGASILVDIEALPHGILFWRSMTHFIGGMGIIVLAIAIMPYFGFGGMQLYNAEASGVTNEKLHPRITQTAKTFWGIYVALVLVQTIFLLFGGMNLFESLCHSFGTLASGGFSPKNSSIAGYSPYIQYVIIVFMIFAGINFTIHYFILNGKWSKIKSNSELWLFLSVIGAATLIITVFLNIGEKYELERAFRDSLFQVVSIITTTGFVTADYSAWPQYLSFIIFLLMFSGGCAGSTAGGIKIMRHNILFRNSMLEFRRMTHPQAVIPLRISGKIIPKEVVFTVLAFVILYIIIFVIGSLALTFMGLSWESAMGATATCMAGIGPGFGEIGNPVGNFALTPDAGKWLLSFLMLLGRLELFSFLILFSPEFWKNS
jgi:trk system potassium uptake protein TrkH